MRPTTESSGASREAGDAGQFDEINRSWKHERPDVDMDGMLLGIAITRMARMIDRSFERACQDRFGVSQAEMRVMLTLRRAGHPYARRPTNLFKSLLVTSGAITKQVDRLIQKGFATRLPDQFHAGSFLIQLTPKGLKTTDDAVATLSELTPVNAALERLLPQEREAGIKFCQHLIREIEKTQ